MDYETGKKIEELQEQLNRMEAKQDLVFKKDHPELLDKDGKLKDI